MARLEAKCDALREGAEMKAEEWVLIEQAWQRERDTLRAENDRLQAENEELIWNLGGISTIACAEDLCGYVAGAKWERAALADTVRLVGKVRALRAKLERLAAASLEYLEDSNLGNAKKLMDATVAAAIEEAKKP